jgi:NhaA family Na+:H+ antiporter
MKKVPNPTAFQKFLHLESAGGLVLMGITVLAFIVANSPLAGLYAVLLNVPLAVSIGDFEIAKPLLLWINDGLMAVFFFLVGLELKREVLQGHLASLRMASLPAAAAVGGMAAPAAIYAWLNWNDPVALNGWAIPAATDIAFALGILALAGPRIPAAVKALLLSVAIFDDLGAIVIIAVFYTAELSYVSLLFAAVCVVGLWLLNRASITRPTAYLLIGIPLWVALLKSGVHATLAGVVAAMAVPMAVGTGPDGEPRESPLKSLEHALHPWVAFGVLPVFAFANAGVSLSGLSIGDLGQTVPLGIALGLLIGKPVGILSFSWLAIRLGLATPGAGMTWRHIRGVSLLCGVGFTMSLFIASLAFEPGAYAGLERLGILAGSITAGLAGYLVLRGAGRAERA